MTWQDAQNSCKDSNGYLATVKDQQDQDALSKARNKWSSGNKVWLGGIVCNKKTYMFKGVSRSGFMPSDCDVPEYCEYTYTKWSSRQPDFARNHEYCIHLWKANTWNDNACSIKIFSICETDAI